jgi:hypothetical protein
MMPTAETATRYTLAFLAGLAAALLAVAYSGPREVVCDHPEFRPHPTAYAATITTCNDGIHVVILD